MKALKQQIKQLSKLGKVDLVLSLMFTLMYSISIISDYSFSNIARMTILLILGGIAFLKLKIFMNKGI